MGWHFEVKKGNFVRGQKAITWNEDKTEATISIHQKIVAGDYSVKVLGLDLEDNTRTFKAENEKVEAIEIVSDIVRLLEVSGNTKAKVLGASFKNVNQVHNTMLAGAKSVTINAETMDRLLYHPLSDWSVDTFVSDWEKVYGAGKTVMDME